MFADSVVTQIEARRLVESYVRHVSSKLPQKDFVDGRSYTS